MGTIKNDHLKFGSPDAPLKIEAFINVGCLGIVRIYQLAKEVLPPYIDSFTCDGFTAKITIIPKI